MCVWWVVEGVRTGEKSSTHESRVEVERRAWERSVCLLVILLEAGQGAKAYNIAVGAFVLRCRGSQGIS